MRFSAILESYNIFELSSNWYINNLYSPSCEVEFVEKLYEDDEDE